MTDSMKETINSINNLISRNQDASSGFVEVANNMNDLYITKWLIEWSKAHEDFSNELKKVVMSLGGEVDGGKTLLGELHHVWVDLKAQLTNNDMEGLIDECLLGENKALEDYKEVISTNVIPTNAKYILERQHAKIKNAINDLELLKEKMPELEQQA